MATSQILSLSQLLAQKLPEATEKTEIAGSPSKSAERTRAIDQLLPMDQLGFFQGLQSNVAVSRLSRTTYPVDVETKRALRNEADVVRLSYEHLTHAVSLAFPELVQVSEQVETGTRIDTLWKLGDEVATILEFKRVGTIDTGEWNKPGLPLPEKKLSKQIRKYAGQHKCPQMALFDYDAMVIFNFEGLTEAEILSTDEVHGFAVEEEGLEPGDLTLREALFLLIQQGYERIMERRRRMGSWDVLRDAKGATCFQLSAMNGSPSMITYWREIDQGGQRVFQNMEDKIIQSHPPTDGLYYPAP